MKLLVFGNILVEKDNLALKLIPKLSEAFPDIEFKEFDPVESLENEIEDKSLFILDVAEGIGDVMIVDNMDKLELIGKYSMHDFDLAYNLKLLKKIGKLKNIRIIAVPWDMNEDEAIVGAVNSINSLSKDLNRK